MNDKTFIELKQSEGELIQTGEWKNTIATPVYVFDGDQIVVSKVFADTEAETDQIIDVPEDVELTTTHILGITNDNLDKFASFSDGSQSIDNVDYWLSKVTENTVTNVANMIHITKMHVNVKGPSSTNVTVGSPDAAHDIVFSYVDFQKNLRTFNLRIPKKTLYIGQGGLPKAAQLDIKMSVFALSDGLKDLFPKASGSSGTQGVTLNLKDSLGNRANVKFNNVTFAMELETSETGGFSFDHTAAGDSFLNDQLTPVVFVHTYTLNGGKYSPNDICSIITNDYSSNAAAKNFQSVDSLVSDFLVNSTKFPAPPANPAVGKTGFVVLSNLGDDGVATARTATVNPQYFIGSEQIELAYNAESGKFFWNYLHFPVYSNSTGQVSTRLLEILAGPPGNPTGAPVPSGKFTHQTRNGSVAFLTLEAKTKDKAGDFAVNSDFWEEKLGFIVSNVVAQPSHDVSFTTGNITYQAETFAVLDGVNTTNAKVALDSLVSKTASQYSYQKIIDTSQGQATIPFIQSNLNDVVEAQLQAIKPIQEITVPYYLVDVRAGFKTDMISSETTSHSIQNVVNRYYSKGSFSVSEDTSLGYTHRGAPLVLSGFHIRILNPQRELVSTLGDNSTIFVEVTRQDPLQRFERENALAEMEQVQAKQNEQTQTN